MNEPMSMATKISMVQEVGTEGEIKSCINEQGQWHEPDCDRVLGQHGFDQIALRLSRAETAPISNRESHEAPTAEEVTGSNYRVEKMLAVTPKIERLQHQFVDHCEGHEVEDCFAAALWHFLALYRYTHTEAQHKNLCHTIFSKILTGLP